MKIQGGIMFSLLNSADSAIRTFFSQLTETLGFAGYLALFVGVEVLFVLLFVLKSVFSYEKRLKNSFKNLNNWLFENKQINENNITEFNRLIKKGPKRLVYYWQQYILYREGAPSKYLTEENLIEKPLKTSSYASNIKNLTVLTVVWGVIAAIFGLASQTNLTLSLQNVAVGLIFSALVAVVGAIAIIILRARRVVNLDDIYHLYHYFARFTDNACAELTPFIDFDLLFTPKEIEKGNVHLREYYEARARKAKEEFERAAKTDDQATKYNFEEVGVDGSLLLNRAMTESEKFLNKKRETVDKIARIDSQKDALRRNYETVQMDLQRKIQATKENIAKLIEQQAATSSRVEVGLLRTQQEKEVAKQASLQKDYDKEEARYNTAKQELEEEIERLSALINDGQDEAIKGMKSEYQSFFAKVMKSAYNIAEKQIKSEKDALKKEADKTEEELINIQTQNKRLKDENDNLRAMLESQKETLRALLAENGEVPQEDVDGHYDEKGNYIYADGSYHDAEGLFHDVDGKVYNMNGELVAQDETPEEIALKEQEQIKQEQINQFGAYVSDNKEAVFENKVASGPIVEPYNPDEEKEEPVGPVVEPYIPDEEETQQQTEEIQEEPTVEEPQEVKRGRGRPRKEVSEEPVKKEPGKRGRPRKEPAAEEAPKAPAKKPGRPRKTEEEKGEPKARKKRGRPRKIVDKTREVKEEGPKRKPGRPRKDEKKQEVGVEEYNNAINQINQQMKDSQIDANKKIDEALNASYSDDKANQKEKLLKRYEELKKQVEDGKKKGLSQAEMSAINKELEDLIKKISAIDD